MPVLFINCEHFAYFEEPLRYIVEVNCKISTFLMYIMLVEGGYRKVYVLYICENLNFEGI